LKIRQKICGRKQPWPTEIIISAFAWKVLEKPQEERIAIP